jgi:TetR/AcrR family transcriptional regulator, tetracycline repressor protein
MSVKTAKTEPRPRTRRARAGTALPGRGGRPAQISREWIVAEARTLPIEKLTMPRIASRLGVNPAALYYHFDSRDALLAELSSLVVSEFQSPPANLKDWRIWLENMTVDVSRFMLANPVVLEVENWSRIEKVGAPLLESVLRALTQAGFHASEALRMWSVLGNIAYAQARLLHDVSRLDKSVRQQAVERYRANAQDFPLTRSAMDVQASNDPELAFRATVRWLVNMFPSPRLGAARIKPCHN